MECYVLSAIDELTNDERKVLDNMTPKLRELYGHSGNWLEILEKEIGIKPALHDRAGK